MADGLSWSRLFHFVVLSTVEGRPWHLTLDDTDEGTIRLLGWASCWERHEGLVIVWNRGEPLCGPGRFRLFDAIGIAVNEVPPNVAFPDWLASEHDGRAGSAQRGGDVGSKHGELTGSDDAAALLFYDAIASAAITATVWLLLGEPDDALIRTITVLIIACPHALGLAIPLVVSLSTAMAARNGILVKDRLALERMRKVDTVLFDKTGTLTAGEHAVTDLAAVDGDIEKMLALAAAVEADSEHPLARAIVNHATTRDIDPPDATNFQSMTGRGVQAVVDGQTIAIGGPSLLRSLELQPPTELGQQTDQWEARGAAVLHVIADNEIIGSIALEDDIRPESQHAIDALHDRNIHVVMITGDSHAVANHVAQRLGIDEVFAEVLPADKDQAVSELQDRGRTVAMVGDGVNDAPALARADVGLAIGAGTDVAIESAGVVLASSDPRNVLGVIELSTASYRKMLQNLAWAAGYNVFAIPLAAGVLAPVGFVLPPAVGALLMSFSTIVVAANAQLLRRVDLSPKAIADASTSRRSPKGRAAATMTPR